MSTQNAPLVTAGFPFGVASGDLTSNSVVLWTKAASAGATVDWWCEPVEGGARLQGSASADPTTGSVHVLVTGIGAAE